MEEYTMMIQRDTFEGAFFRAVLHIHTNNFVRAQSVSAISYSVLFSPVSLVKLALIVFFLVHWQCSGYVGYGTNCHGWRILQQGL